MTSARSTLTALAIVAGIAGASVAAVGATVTLIDVRSAPPAPSPEAPVYDAVVMNPPFERGQDVEHVMHAWRFVKPGGAVIAIMGAGVRYRGQRPYSTFRDWMDGEEVTGADVIDIPAGAFKESGTGVASVMVCLYKPDL